MAVDEEHSLLSSSGSANGSCREGVAGGPVEDAASDGSREDFLTCASYVSRGEFYIQEDRPPNDQNVSDAEGSYASDHEEDIECARESSTQRVPDGIVEHENIDHDECDKQDIECANKGSHDEIPMYKSAAQCDEDGSQRSEENAASDEYDSNGEDIECGSEKIPLNSHDEMPLHDEENDNNVITNAFVEDEYEDEAVQREVPNLARRKRVKHRQVKAAIMMCTIWSITLILVSIALGLDWWGVNESMDRTEDETLCVLCGDGLEYMLDENIISHHHLPFICKVGLLLMAACKHVYLQYAV